MTVIDSLELLYKCAYEADGLQNAFKMFKKLKMKCTEIYWILFYNHFASTTYIADTLFEPFYWFVSKIAKRAGPIFVACVILLTSSVVVIYYCYIFPWNSERWPFSLNLANYIFGHWLLLNIVFHYFMAVTTPPGQPPPKVDSPVSICKNCIIPKPPRTHHCSVCKQCVLKMDHHCPWLNNCVGHYNHRYFFLFGVYMCSGTIFVSLSIYNQFHTYFAGSFLNLLASALMPVYALIVGPTYAHGNSGVTDGVTTSVELSEEELTTRFWVTYELFLCTGVTFALGALVLWHARLISKGETSIEKHINARERRRMKELGAPDYSNPYDFGITENWKVFFGIEAGTGRSWRHILLPSTHCPTGDGKSWRTISSKSD